MPSHGSHASAAADGALRASRFTLPSPIEQAAPAGITLPRTASAHTGLLPAACGDCQGTAPLCAAHTGAGLAGRASQQGIAAHHARTSTEAHVPTLRLPVSCLRPSGRACPYIYTSRLALSLITPSALLFLPSLLVLRTFSMRTTAVLAIAAAAGTAHALPQPQPRADVNASQALINDLKAHNLTQLANILASNEDVANTIASSPGQKLFLAPTDSAVTSLPTWVSGNQTQLRATLLQHGTSAFVLPISRTSRVSV